MQVRKATEADIPAIVRMGAQFYATTSYREFADYDEDTASTLVAFMVDTGICLIAEDEGRPVGMVGLVVAPFMFNNAHKTAHEVMWWVDPSERNTGAGVALLRAIEPACREAGCVAIQMVHLADSPPQAGLLYRRRGYEHTETCFTKVISQEGINAWQL